MIPNCLHSSQVNFGGESWVLIADDLSGKSKAYENVFQVQCCCLFCTDFFNAWNKNRGLHAVVVSDGENCVIPLQDGKFGDEVKSDGFRKIGCKAAQIGRLLTLCHWHSAQP